MFDVIGVLDVALSYPRSTFAPELIDLFSERFAKMMSPGIFRVPSKSDLSDHKLVPHDQNVGPPTVSLRSRADQTCERASALITHETSLTQGRNFLRHWGKAHHACMLA